MSQIDETLDTLAPADLWAPDWDDVLRRGPVSARRSHRFRRGALACAVLALAVALPAIALSASVRGWLGIAPRPVLDKARLVASAPIPGHRVARLWVGPSTTGGTCEFTTITPENVVAVDPSTGKLRPTTQVGGGSCSIGKAALPAKGFTWSLSTMRPRTPRLELLEGHFGGPRPARVVVRWHGGQQRIASADGFFVGAIEMRNPSFRRLPFDVVALDANGRTIATSRIPTSFLYDHWKRVQPRLHDYRRAHGCSTSPLWACRSR